MINRVTGTEDILDMRMRETVIGKLKKHLELFNFSQIQTPILEYTNLFIHSLGEQTDVVGKEMYVFAGNEQEKSICLRPEATASAIRACIENGIARFPWKTFLIGPMFRRERPQKGRLRQFTQMSVEVIGSNSVMHDAHFIKTLDSMFSSTLPLGQLALLLNFLGCHEDRRKHKARLLEFLKNNGASICTTCQQRKESNTLRVFDCKNEACQKLYTTAPKTADELCENCTTEWETLQQTLMLLDVNFVVAPTLVRGLDYYHKTVFEFTSQALGAQSTFCAGGRYLLGKEAGAKEDFNCVGAAIGIERVLLMLEAQQNGIPLPAQTPLHLILPLATQQDQLGLMIAHHLGQHGLRCDVLLEKASMTNMMKKANNLGAAFALVIGENEQKDNVVAVKNMTTGTTTAVKQAELVAFLKS